MPPSISLFMFLLAPAQRWARIRLLVCSLFHLKLKSFRIANKGRRTHTSNCTPWKTMRTIEWWKARKNIYRREQRNDKWWSGEEMLLAKKQHGYPVRLGSDRFSSQQQAKSTTTMPMPIMTEEEAQAKKIAHKHSKYFWPNSTAADLHEPTSRTPIFFAPFKPYRATFSQYWV